MKTINIMINGLPGRLATIFALAALADQRFKVIPYSLTGKNPKEKHLVLNQYKIELINPQLRDKAAELIKSQYPFFIAVDYTHPLAVNSNAQYYVKHKIPFVMGTTGGDRKSLETLVKSASDVSAVVAPNMASQIVGFQAMMKYAAENFPDLFKDYTLELVESHQHNKADTSGTARAMVQYFNRLGIEYKEDDIQMIRDPKVQEKDLGVPKEHLDGHAWHTYTLRAKDGSALFEFKHNVNGRNIYVDGTFSAILFLKKTLESLDTDSFDKGKRFYTMIDVLSSQQSQFVTPCCESVQPKEILPYNLEESAAVRHLENAALSEHLNNSSHIDLHSQNHEKISLFMSLFKGRTDVYAKKWQNKKGFSGYSPVCLNEWVPGICNKPIIKCSGCKNKSYEALNESAFEKHLRGECVIGLYPMNLDETCYFLAIDFDKQGWKEDVAVIRDICEKYKIPVAIERSQSGDGCHAWFFFDQKIAAVHARKFGTSLLTHSMSSRHKISFKSYDRLFPNQDTMPKGGLGNLIALPLQKTARDNENSVFIDKDFKPYPDQWQFLSHIQKLTEKDLTSFITKTTQDNELGILKEDTETLPWKRRAAFTVKKHDFPETVQIVKSGMLYIEKQGLSQKALNTIKRYAAFKNPEFYKAQAMRLPTFGKPRVISCSDDYENHLALPRGCENDIISLLKSHNIQLIQKDEFNHGKTINVEFKGKLRDEQQQACDALSTHENGVLSAATAFGKTVIGAKLISTKKVSTLVLVHRQQLLSQWQERLGQFLNINESIPETSEISLKKGQQKKRNLIGHMAAGKEKLSLIVDVALMQSMYSKGEVREVINNYGMILVDECHHVPAVTFEQILKKAGARYIYGLTATPARPDGHHPIIFFYCGPMRYSVDAKEQAQKRPFDHYLVPRFTSFKMPPDEGDRELSFQEIKNYLLSDEIRNQMIIDDVLDCCAKGRKSLILTGRVAHVEELGKKLKEKQVNVICLTGGMTAKKTALTMEKIKNIKDNEPFVLVATGSYIGEGFDEARLDTLFLAMPIAWKGTLQQYAGRLHRFSKDKKDVQIYDYIDFHIKMLEKMYEKRLKGYASIGYKTKTAALPEAPTDFIFNKNTFFPVYLHDINNAAKHIMIFSPFVTEKRMLQMMGHLSTALEKRVKITIITRPAHAYKEEIQLRLEKLFSMTESAGVHLIFKPRIHQKFTIIDNRITWYGSINFLSFGFSEESVMRLESSSIACELVESIDYADANT